MRTLSTTRLSSKGQVVIPEEVRERLGLVSGTEFAVVAEDDVVVLKRIKAPSMKEFDRLVRIARRQARKSGMTRADIVRAVSVARRRK